MANDFFLDADEAKSLGNTEFMRKPTKTRRTFPKTASSQGLEIVQEVSSLSQKVYKTENGLVSQSSSSVNSSSMASSFGSTSSNGAEAPKASESRRSTDTNLDMFRSMAKDLRR